MGRPDVLVVGAGVTGLTTAAYLAERQYAVRLIADRLPHRTASAAAGAIWGPYLVDEPQHLRWAEVARAELERIADEPGTGVRMTRGLEVSVKPEDPPEWATRTRDYRPCTAAELEPFRPTYRSGWYYTVPLIDMPAYLGYLAQRALAAGAAMEPLRRITSLGALRGEAAVVVNCTGLGARELVPDASMYAIRGQLVVVENPGVEEFFQENANGEELTYIFPHADHVVLGGCAVDHNETGEARNDVAEAILERCARIQPKLAAARIIGHRVGLRPARPRPRVEIAPQDGAWLVHNYGHGATGVSLSWGCAEEVGRLLQ
jgi:D-amino-acid oxidase